MLKQHSILLRVAVCKSVKSVHLLHGKGGGEDVSSLGFFLPLKHETFWSIFVRFSLDRRVRYRLLSIFFIQSS
jgi:hypothetical protein